VPIGPTAPTDASRETSRQIAEVSHSFFGDRSAEAFWSAARLLKENSVSTHLQLAEPAVRLLEPLLTIVEVAEVLKVSTRTVRRMIKSKTLASVRVGRSVRVRVDDLSALARAC
jgi:excisionase family DNA binding protein